MYQSVDPPVIGGRSGNAFRDGKVHVLADKCATCIFRAGNLMHLRPGRLAEMVNTSVAEGGAIVCHKTLGDDVDDAVCRGFHDAYGNQVPALRLATALDLVVEDDLEANPSS